MGTWAIVTTSLIFLFSQLAFAGNSCGVRGSHFDDGQGSRFKLYFYPHENPEDAERFDRVLEGYNTQIFSETKWWLDSHGSDHKINIRTAFLRILGDLEAGANWVGVEGSTFTRDSSEDIGAIEKNVQLLIRHGVTREAAEEAIMIRRGAGEFAVYRYLQKRKTKRKIMIIGLDSHYSDTHFENERMYRKKVIGYLLNGQISYNGNQALENSVFRMSQEISFFERVFRIKALKNSGFVFSTLPEIQNTVLMFLNYAIETNTTHALRDEHMARQVVTNLRKGFGTGTIGSQHQLGMKSYLNEWCKNGRRFPASKL